MIKKRKLTKYQKDYDEMVKKVIADKQEIESKAKLEQLEDLKTRYFIGQKLEEITAFIIYVTASLILWRANLGFMQPTWFGYTGHIVGYIEFSWICYGFALCELLIMWCIIALFKQWIKSNWDKAEERARDELGMQPPWYWSILPK